MQTPLTRWRTLTAGGLGLLLLLGATACAAEPTATVTTTEQPPAPQVSESAEERWERFSDPRFPQSFELPPGWAVRESPSAYDAAGPYQFEILDAEGETQLRFMTGMQGLGGACTDALPALVVEELDSRTIELPGYAAPTAAPEQLVPPRVVFRASELEDRVLTSLSVSNNTPADACMYYNLLHLDAGPMAFADAVQVDSSTPNPAPPRTFASMDEARAFMQTEEYATLGRILGSLSLEP